MFETIRNKIDTILNARRIARANRKREAMIAALVTFDNVALCIGAWGAVTLDELGLNRRQIDAVYAVYRLKLKGAALESALRAAVGK